ncbi:MAG: DNA polymerase domain-containing protein [Nanoarchaeota archaeon]
MTLKQEFQTDFIPIDYDYFDFQGKNYIRVIGRNNKGKRICLVDTCDIYFWAILENKIKNDKIDALIEKIKKIKLDIKGRKTRVEKVELHEKNFLGKKVQALKIFATNYKDLHDIADKLDMKGIKKRRGYDLGFITHYIIERKLIPLKECKIQGEIFDNTGKFGGLSEALDVDLCVDATSCKEIKPSEPDQKKSIKKNIFKPRILGYDIETDKLKLGQGQILMVSLVDNQGFEKVITWKKTTLKKQKYVEYVEDESELIEKFSIAVKEQEPDFLVGYNSDNFDLPYLKSRAEKYNIKLSLGLDNSQPRFSRPGASGMTGKIFGITHIDLLKFVKTAYSQYLKSETLSLNEVARELLKDTKKKFDLKLTDEIPDGKLKDFYEYNLHDSKLVIGLIEKMWPDLLEFTKTVQEPVFEVSRAGLSKYTESYILHNLEKFNEIPEKRPVHDEISSRRARGGVKGAFVFEPTPGIYENLAMFDFTSMHTSIIISHNISKSTLVQEQKENSKNVYSTPEIEFENEKKKFYFSKEPGFFPLLLKEIFLLRKKFKSQYKKNPNPLTLARSNAFKVLSASAHGYLGFFGARYYSKEASASVLALVRKYNKEIINKVEKSGFKVIFGDTDSVGFTLKNKTRSEVKELLKKLNSELPGVMELELEGFFKRGIWVTTRGGNVGAKKKYALIDDQGKIKIRGFETVRRDWCALAREVQNKVIRLILEHGNETQAMVYLREIIQKLKQRKIQLKELTIKTQLKKPLSEYKAISPHVVAARKMKEQKIPISQGNLILYYVSEMPNNKSKSRNNLVRERVKLPNEKGQYDIGYYLNRQILPAVENILHLFNINIKEIIEGKKQTTLGDF